MTVSSSLPWSGTLIPPLYGGCSALTVPAGVTLTLGAGTVIKGQSNGCAYLNVQGSLVATGTAANPVTLTSWRDDGVGGDTNGDGNATGPVKGDWGGNQRQPGPQRQSRPNHERGTHPGEVCIQLQSTPPTETSIRIVDSNIEHVDSHGIMVSSPVGIPTITGNTVTRRPNDAIRLRPTRRSIWAGSQR